MALPVSYNVRSTFVRWPTTLLAVLGIALVVAVFVVMLAMTEGFSVTLRSTGRTDNAMIVERGSTSEHTSFIRIAQRKTVLDDPRVRRGPDGRVLASWERLEIMVLPRRSDGER